MNNEQYEIFQDDGEDGQMSLLAIDTNRELGKSHFPYSLSSHL